MAKIRGHQATTYHALIYISREDLVFTTSSSGVQRRSEDDVDWGTPHIDADWSQYYHGITTIQADPGSPIANFSRGRLRSELNCLNFDTNLQRQYFHLAPFVLFIHSFIRSFIQVWFHTILNCIIHSGIFALNYQTKTNKQNNFIQNLPETTRNLYTPGAEIPVFDVKSSPFVLSNFITVTSITLFR